MTEEIYTIYAKDDDITFIMKSVSDENWERIVEVVGFYYGEPTQEYTKLFNGKLKAEF